VTRCSVKADIIFRPAFWVSKNPQKNFLLFSPDFSFQFLYYFFRLKLRFLTAAQPINDTFFGIIINIFSEPSLHGSIEHKIVLKLLTVNKCGACLSALDFFLH
jgi:hypothetical protein